MKVCKNCEFKQERTIPINGRLESGVYMCTHEECVDPVVGEPVLCSVSRREPAFCGINGRYFKLKEVTPDPEKQNVIQLK